MTSEISALVFFSHVFELVNEAEPTRSISLGYNQMIEAWLRCQSKVDKLNTPVDLRSPYGSFVDEIAPRSVITSSPMCGPIAEVIQPVCPSDRVHGRRCIAIKIVLSRLC